ncbi:SRPBCC family protein [Pseudonocardia sp. GCM10023141]|uniref:SRPBCC family protein n=1 Tax=Pseudonocardia sp. GCM10023141 TaxID=3252653 RepID=UPI003606AFA1
MDEATVTIDAEPSRVWATITDITRMGEWSPECRGGRWVGGAAGPAAGARFIGSNAHGLVRWRTHCQVVVCEPETRFAFTVAESGMTWGWRVDPEDGGTRLTQWRDHTSKTPLVARIATGSGLLGKNRETLMVDGMHRTLEAVKTRLERMPV